MTDLADGTECTVVRWRRFGHDRLYVNGADGSRIGWHDLQSGESTVELEERRGDFERAIAEHLVADAVAQPSVNATPESEPEAEAKEAPQVELAPQTLEPEAPWTDLALNRPGEGVSAEAKKAFAEAPVRSLTARVLGVHTNERAWRIGAKGESLVGKQLAKLEPEWRAIHSIPVGTKGSDIDHLAIGPGGVYTINAKHHPEKDVWVHRDTFIVNGTRTKYVRNARFEAHRAQELLSGMLGFSVPVIGLIAVVGAHEGFTIKEQPRDGRVIVLPRKAFADWLGRRGPILTVEQIDAVFEAARRSTTWT